ncbi:putative transcription factor B3-Domain family [Rosa chinensis]|uniref:Putative transcription factor B3-Domain family n=1 Tax=Rosa chinensis TaxID=74649 RepID=A0A2P6QI58_ROSCH|nr:putative transcription factor B3-Domain family [Rosa chinensis]
MKVALSLTLSRNCCFSSQTKSPIVFIVVGLVMASSSRRKSSAKGVASPSFFKVVVDEALEDGMLEIEGYVARNYEDFLGCSVVLTDPKGSMWPMELKRSNGSVWLKKGWLEFANFYSLKQGCFIFFTHKGFDSGFQVRIFNKRWLEIDYPFKSSHQEDCKFRRGGDEAFTRAKRFKSNHPCLAVRMQPSYLLRGLKLNATFVNENICATGATRKIKLQIPNGKTWSAKCSVYLCMNKDYAKICSGWTKFAAENKLQVGDACALELIKECPKLTFLVHIFRAN